MGSPATSFYDVNFDQTLEEAFPKVDPGVKPYGSRVLVQIRTAKNKTKGGLILVNETREIVANNTQTAKVVSMGPLAFHNRDTMKPWPEGSWCKPGDFVRVPRFGGDRWEKSVHDDKGEEVGKILFIIFNDLDIIGQITCDPREIVAFV